MLLADTGVVANASVAHAGPDHGESHTHCKAVQTPFSEHSRSEAQGVGACPAHSAGNTNK